MARRHKIERATIRSYQAAEEFLGTRERRKYAANTYLERLSATVIGVIYHATFIVKFQADGGIELNSGGYHTMSTRERMNEFLPKGPDRVHVATAMGKQYVSFYPAENDIDKDWSNYWTELRSVDFIDGMVIYSREVVLIDLGPGIGVVGAPDADIAADKRAYNRGRRFNGRRSTPAGQPDRVWQRGENADGYGEYGYDGGPEWTPEYVAEQEQSLVRNRAQLGGFRVNSTRGEDGELLTVRERDEQEIQAELERRDRDWRDSMERQASSNPESDNYVPEFARKANPFAPDPVVTPEPAEAEAEPEYTAEPTETRPVFEECGCCGHLHRPEFRGDCRNDDQRFLPYELDETYGENGWIEVTLGEQAFEGDSEAQEYLDAREENDGI